LDIDTRLRQPLRFRNRQSEHLGIGGLNADDDVRATVKEVADQRWINYETAHRGFARGKR
jgi:hypothetical protein